MMHGRVAGRMEVGYCLRIIEFSDVYNVTYIIFVMLRGVLFL
jgi:hypothetical protein